MRQVTDGLLGVVARPGFRLEVWKLQSPETRGSSTEGDYIYLTKASSNSETGQISFGMGSDDLTELLVILNEYARQ